MEDAGTQCNKELECIKMEDGESEIEPASMDSNGKRTKLLNPTEKKEDTIKGSALEVKSMMI